MKHLPFLCSLAAILALPSFASALTPDVPERLAVAREELTELKKRYLDKHPRLVAQQARVKELEERAKAPREETPELRAGREELAVLRQRYDDQLQKVAIMEREATRSPKAAGDSQELQAARTAFDLVKERYGVRHPKYQMALKNVEKWKKAQRAKK